MPSGKRKSSSAVKGDGSAGSPSSSISDKRRKIAEDVKEEVSEVPVPIHPTESSGQKPEKPKVEDEENDVEESRFIGDSVPDNEARQRWPHRYLQKNKLGKTGSLETSKGSESEEHMQAKTHFTQELVDGRVHDKLGDDGYIQMARRGRGASSSAVREAIELPPQPPHTDHQWLRFPDTLPARFLRSYRTELARLSTKPIEVPHTLDWSVPNDAQFTEQLIDTLTQTFTDEAGVTLFTCHGWSRLFHVSESIYRELVLEFLSTFSFKDASVDYDDRTVLAFRLGGESREISVREFSWRVGIHTRQETTSVHFLPFLRACLRGRPLDFHEVEFWQTIANGAYQPDKAVESMIHHPIHRLIHRLLTTSISHRKGGEKVPALDLHYLHCILTPGVWYNIPYALALFLSARAKGLRHNSPICGGHFITRLVRSFGILTDEVERGLMRMDVRLFDISALETMHIVERDIAGTHLVAANLVQQAPVQGEGEPVAEPRRHRHRRRSPEQSAQPELTLQDLARAQVSMQACIHWMTTELGYFFHHQGYRPRAPPPPLVSTFPHDVVGSSQVPHGGDE